MRKPGIVVATVLAAGMLVPHLGQAVIYGEPDCGPSGCSHPNVVMLGPVLTGTTGEGWYCSGTLIHRTQDRYLFLTAGHCTEVWGRLIAVGMYSSVGVSFDPVVEREDLPDGSPFMDPDQFVAGGVPVTHPDFAPDYHAWNLMWDYGIVSVPRAEVDAKWPQVATLPMTRLAFEVGLRLEDMVAGTMLPQKNLLFYTVGYGVTELLDKGSNAGGPNYWLSGIGTRRIADRQTFTNLRKTLVQTSQNWALGNNGGCSGDSGGPTFYQTDSGPVEVGIVSSGDYMCRATNTSSRMDVETAQWFVECARANPANVKNCGF
jgi:hypothetical protein